MSDLAKNVANNATNFGKEQIEKLLKQDNDTFFSIMIGIMSGIIIFIIIIYIILQVSKKRDNISTYEKKYKTYYSNTKSKEFISIKDDLTGVNRFKYPTRDGEDGKSTGRLCDYFIASSYNSCCSGDFKDDYVDIEALKNAIQQGARVLDFQIFSINGDLIVSASDNETQFMKGTYNYLPLTGINGVFNIVEKYAFSDFCPNRKDPLFLNLRIQSEKTDIYDKLTEICSGVFKDRLLSVIYGYEQERSGIDILKTGIENFYEKIIIICDQKNKNFKDTSFHAFVNLSPQKDDGPLVAYKNYQVNFAEESKTIRKQSKNKIIMVYPDNTNINDNRDPANLFNMGCSIIFMNYQKLDTNLITYLNTFGQPQEYNAIGFQAFAYLLKKDSLRPDIKKVEENKCDPDINHDQNYIFIEIITEKEGIKYGYRAKISKFKYTSHSHVETAYKEIKNMGGKRLYFQHGNECKINTGNDYPYVKIYNGEALTGNACYGKLGECTYNLNKPFKITKDEYGNYLEVDEDATKIYVSLNDDTIERLSGDFPCNPKLPYPETLNFYMRPLVSNEGEIGITFEKYQAL